MRAFETMYILRPDLDEEAIDAAVERFKSLIEDQGGTVENIDKWGKRRLAYEIEGCREGFYVLVHWQGDSAVSRELERVLKITGEVLRHINVRREQ